MIEMRRRVLPAREFRSAEALDDDPLVAGNAFLGGKRVENLEEAISVDVGSTTDGRIVHPKKPNKDHHDICRIESERNDRNELMRRREPVYRESKRGRADRRNRQADQPDAAHVATKTIVAVLLEHERIFGLVLSMTQKKDDNCAELGVRRISIDRLTAKCDVPLVSRRPSRPGHPY